jgi:hypothetical protein
MVTFDYLISSVASSSPHIGGSATSVNMIRFVREYLVSRRGQLFHESLSRK